jgi:outer membrane protein assembly complex protein YaeT
MASVRRLFLALSVALAVSACREDGPIKIDRLTFAGVEQVDPEALAGALQTREGSWLPWGRQRDFDQRAFEADLQRIVAFYRDRGFPDARVSATDIDLNDAQDEVDVTVHVVEGEPVRIAAIDLDGFEVLPEAERRRLETGLPISVGQPRDTELVSASQERALDALRNHGYPYAEVVMSTEAVGNRLERLALRAVPGTLARFGPVEVNGASGVEEAVILRQMTFEPGELFTRDKLRASQRRLYGTELFQFAHVEPLLDETATPAEVPVRITVAEGKHRRITFGIGYGSEERARARARWDHLNFLGGARRVSLEGRWSSLDSGVRAEFRQPSVFHPDVSFSVQAQAWRAEEPVYSQTTVGGRVGLRHEPTPQNAWSVSLINEYQRSRVAEEALAPEHVDIRDDLIALGLDPRGFDTEGTLSAMAVDAGRNTTTNLLDARRGYVLNARVERAGPWFGGTYEYWSVTAEARHYQTVAGLFVVANRLTVGSIDPAGGVEANVPFHKRLFVGGASSNRGWGRFEIAPLEAGFPIGGLSMLDGAAEIRFPVWRNLGGVVFLDYSNVWTRPLTVDLRDLRYAAGPGLRYQTPIGPARVDAGYQWNPVEGLLVDGEPQKRQWRVHFSIGQAF